MSSDDESASAASINYEEELHMIRANDPLKSMVDIEGSIQNMTDDGWEQHGRDISVNTHLTEFYLSCGALNDHTMSFFFRGLTRSSSIYDMGFYGSELSVAAVRSMVPFLQNARHLTQLDLDDNNLQSEGFNVLLRALRDSPIETLRCGRCDIESPEIDSNHIPRNLKELHLDGNIINADGCRELAKLLQRGDANLELLCLHRNKIDDDGVDILMGALQNNVSLTRLYLSENDAISSHGQTMLLKLVNDISSIEATLRSNHTLKNLLCADDQIETHINKATRINWNTDSPEAAGREKAIQTQLNSKRRAELAALQGVNHSVYSEINPLHLPEVLALVGRHHGQKELYIALKSSIAGVISTVNREQCIEAQMAYHASKLEQLGAELAAIKAAKGGRAEDAESRSSKRRRKWWWELWGR